jgi:nitroimidazol reductase NimA-like FMN-containing flavoprotein (pyridoxamine 5'-phosphate oxidase superfamily)
VTTEARGLDALSRADCDRLLSSSRIGRVILTAGALPVAFPVNYGYDGSHIVFRTGEGTKLSAARGEMVVAFEVDDFDLLAGTGWSVLVTGVARLLTEPGAIVRADQLAIDSWLPHNRQYVAIEVGLVSGRRIPPR